MHVCNTDGATRRSPAPYYRLNPQLLDRPRYFFHHSSQARGLPAIVVSALQVHSRCDATNVNVGTIRDLRDDMLGYLTAKGRFLGFDRGDWALLLGAFPLVALVTLLSI